MKTNTLLLASLASLGLFACGDDINKTTVDAKVTPGIDANKTPDAFVTPAAPTLGAQIDRMGRPAINTALNHPFELAANNTTIKQPAKDAYNAAANPATWATTVLGTGDIVVTQFEHNLGIIDGLDSTATVDGCSATHHPPFYDTSKTDATAYQTLAGALAADALLVNTTTGNCHIAGPRTGYLAVEAHLSDPVNVPGGFCGGRTPTEDVIDVSYTALAAGIGPALNPATWVSDGVDSKLVGAGNDDTFPFLAAP
jgi:hypothetical protein